ncbi:hypothetical protein PCL_12674, partial [Purpureocillium lilacinum]
TWAGVLKIVRWHVSECRPKWLPVEGSDKPPEAKPSTQAANLTDAFCNSDRQELQSGDGTRGSRGPQAEDDGSMVVVAAAAAAKAPGVDRPDVDPKPAAKEAAGPAAKPDATRNASVPQVGGPRCMVEGRPPDKDGRRKALTDKAQGNCTAQAPARKKQQDQLVSREGRRRGPETVAPQRQAASNGWVEPPPVRSGLSSKPGSPGRALTKCGRAPLADMLARM